MICGQPFVVAAQRAPRCSRDCLSRLALPVLAKASGALRSLAARTARGRHRLWDVGRSGKGGPSTFPPRCPCRLRMHRLVEPRAVVKASPSRTDSLCARSASNDAAQIRGRQARRLAGTRMCCRSVRPCNAASERSVRRYVRGPGARERSLFVSRGVVVCVVERGVFGPGDRAVVGRSVVVGFGSDFSEEPAFQDGEPVTLDSESFLSVLPGPLHQRAVKSTWSWRQTASLIRRFNVRSASFFVLPSAILRW